MAEPKRLKPVELPELGDLKPLPLPGNSELAYRQRLELIVAQYDAISPELAHARIEEARAMSEQARYQFAVPAEEKTKQARELTQQVRTIGYVVIAVVVACVIGILIRPQAATQLATIAGVVVGVYGGIYGLEQFMRRRRESKNTAPHDAPPKSS